jgi:hypothetical protein
LLIEGCKKLQTVHLLAATANDNSKRTAPTIAVVELSTCQAIRVIISRKVADLRLLSCKELVLLTIQNSVGRLLITDSPELKDLQASVPIYKIVNGAELQGDYTLTFYENDEE